MAFLLGTDEAGYGPNLGPLVVSASLWEVPDGVQGDQLAGLLCGAVAAAPGKRLPPECVVIGDSKVLYQPGKGLGHLEAGLWAAMGLLGSTPRTWCEVWRCLAPDAAADLQAEPWTADYDRPVAGGADPQLCEARHAALRTACQRAGVRLVALRSRAVFPAEFNRLVAEHASKGAALSHISLALAARLLADVPQAGIHVLCDKHGGRNRYAEFLMQHFPDAFIEIHGEGRERSVYRFGPAPRRIEFRFQVRGDSHLPAALASMASKYLRELAMEAWNDFWCRRISGLQPTAGYPVDALRFKQAIAETQKSLAIDDGRIWRVK